MALYRSYPATTHSFNATARPGIITGDSCKAWRLTFAESTALYSPSTWIGVTHQNIPSRSSMVAKMHTGRCNDCSLPNSGLKRTWRLGSMLPQCLKIVGILPNLIDPNLTRLVSGRSILVTISCGGGWMKRSSRNCKWPAPPRPRRSVSRTPTRWRIMPRQRTV